MPKKKSSDAAKKDERSPSSPNDEILWVKDNLGPDELWLMELDTN